ncbi:hypothetical protein [Vibrio parahaemolyticus]|uniref:hypothetical protein n=1 Tax=Vibrio parahaemolyticus TaxID=670 RepID=UPI00111D1862|nr:hypothetical protein [Vibrio parahaemolyticus]TOD58962.1 hypothetical protein CGJ61_23080 [Vibrio parahaemolyticus]
MKDIIARAAEKASEIASVLERNGYHVIIEPSPKQVPIDLSSYQPDLVAIKNDGGLVVEIKTSLKRLPTRKFVQIAQRVAANQGWKFALVTLDDDVNNIISVMNSSLPEPEELKSKISDINTLINMGMLPSALIFLWVQLESWLRIKAGSSNDNLNLLQPKRLINHLYSDGELSMAQVDLLNELMMKRNEVVHGFNTEITKREVYLGMQLLNEIIESVEG